MRCSVSGFWMRLAGHGNSCSSVHKRGYGKFGRIGNGKSACAYQSIAHEKRVYREQSANPEAFLPASPLSLAEFDPRR
jgi:hypothetical protein